MDEESSKQACDNDTRVGFQITTFGQNNLKPPILYVCVICHAELKKQARFSIIPWS